MKKERLYIFDDDNLFLKVLVGPTQEEKLKYKNTLLNPSTKHVKKYPMERWKKETGQIVVHNKKQSQNSKALVRRLLVENDYKELELKVKQVLESVKNQNLDLEMYRRENKKLKSKFSWGKILALSAILNVAMGAILLEYLTK